MATKEKLRAKRDARRAKHPNKPKTKGGNWHFRSNKGGQPHREKKNYR